MAPQYLWGLVAIGLGIAELASGSFYLLVLAVGAASAGVAAAVGLSGTAQLLIAAAVSAAGAVLVRQLLRRRRGGPRLPASMNANVNLDIGAAVQVEAWSSDRRARVRYRGAEWDVELLPGADAVPGQYRIREVVGSRLRVAPDQPG